MNTSAVRMAAVRTARAHDWKPFVKNTLRGFFSLTLPSGMIVHDLTLHAKNDSRWVGMPSKKFTKSDESVSYTPTIEFVDRGAADRFRDMAIAALREIGVME